MFRNPLPPASGTTILGTWCLVGIAGSAVLRHFGYPAEAAAALAAVGCICHPQVNRSVPVSDAPPNETLAGATVGDRLG